MFFFIFKVLEPEDASCFKNRIVTMRTNSKKHEEQLKKATMCWMQHGPDKVVTSI